LIDHARFSHVGNPSVNHHRRIQHQGPRPLDLFRKFHVRDDEPKIILCLEQSRDAYVTDENHHEAQTHHVDPGIKVELHRRLQRIPQEIGQEYPHDQPDIHRRDRRNPFPGREPVDHHNGDGREHHPDEQDVRIGELVLAHDLCRPDTQSGNNEYEDGADQSQ
jgi:hypothetical protein